jgi:spermidine/putrescine ABC transporter ATP-binding subunit
VSELRIIDVECTYGKVVAVKRSSLDVRSGEFVTLLGPSGSGKTTLLRAIGGYIRPSHGQIHVAGTDITRLSPQRRDIGMVFQQYALFPHMRVFDNVAFGLRARRVPRDEIAVRVAEALQRVQLPDLGQRFPHELSGGQKQRVALARAIVIRPRLLLMDEPLGALDLKLREAMQLEIRRIQEELGITTVYVTHDQAEAFAMSDRIIVMSDGRIVEIGTPAELYARPRQRFTAEFVGQVTLLPTELLSWNGAAGQVRPVGWRQVVRAAGPPPPPGTQLYVSLRPESVRCSLTASDGAVPGTVTGVRFTGMHRLLNVRTSTSDVVVLTESRSTISTGDDVYVSFVPEEAHVVREEREPTA